MASVVCAKCSKWELIDGKWVRTQVRHPSPAAVKVCYMQAHRAKTESK